MIKVLIVDDDKLVRKGLISAMPWAQFDMRIVGEASNGAKALEFLEQESVDLLLTDLEMPVMSGIELMKTVSERYPHIRIVVLTLHQDFEYIQTALRMDAIDYIAKIQLEKERFDEVLGRIHKRMKERSPFAEPQSATGRPETTKGGQGPEGSEEESDRLRSRWLSLEWVYNEELFRQLLGESERLRLPQAKMLGMFFYLTEQWNEKLAPIFRLKIDGLHGNEDWGQIERWLADTRDLIRRTMEKSSYSREVMDCVMKAIEIIHEEFDQQITAILLARRVNLSRSYFSQCFKIITGKPFNDYIREFRIRKAMEYLRHSAKTVHWIAENVGYLDEKYFSRIFREHTGMLPSEYRLHVHRGRTLSEDREDK